MNKQNILFLTLIILLLINIICLNLNRQNFHGEIKEIKYGNNKITLTLKNNPEKYILFTKEIIDLNKNNRVKIIGKHNTYNGETQIIVNKITKLN